MNTEKATEKEFMRDTIKNLQARTENIEKLLEKGNKTIVLELGSHTIKFGLANDRAPYKVRSLIAYKINNTVAANINPNQSHKQQTEHSQPGARVEGGMEIQEQEPANNHEAQMTMQQKFQQEFANLQASLKQKGHMKEMKAKGGKPKGKTQVRMKNAERPYKEFSPLFDEHVFWVQDNPEYVVHQPIKYGYLNVEEYPLTTVIEDLRNILVHSLREKLKLAEKDFPFFSVILILPDQFLRPHAKELVKLFLTTLGFKSIYLHLSSVLACFGAAVSSACVVDIGYEKTTVCCVDEGVVLPGTVIRKNFGGRRLDQIIIREIELKQMAAQHKNNQVEAELVLGRFGDENTVEKLKERICSVKDVEDHTSKLYEIYPIRFSRQQTLVVTTNHSFCVAANSLTSRLWNYLPPPSSNPYFDPRSSVFSLYEDNEDHYEEFSGGGDIFGIPSDNLHYNPDMHNPFVYNQLEEMICYSISAIKDPEYRKKMIGSILLVGGTCHLSGLVEDLEERVLAKMLTYDETAQRVYIIDLAARDIVPIYTSWVGGTVIPKLDSLKELWIERARFVGELGSKEEEQEEQTAPVAGLAAEAQKRLNVKKEKSQEWGMRYLKQKLPFQW